MGTAAGRGGQRRSVEREKAMRSLVAKWRESGQTKKAFAEEHAISYSGFRWWFSELKRRDEGRERKKASSGTQRPTALGEGLGLVPVQILGPRRAEHVLAKGGRPGKAREHGRCSGLEELHGSGPYELVLYDQVRIRVPPDFDPEVLRSLLDTLEARC